MFMVFTYPAENIYYFLIFVNEFVLEKKKKQQKLNVGSLLYKCSVIITSKMSKALRLVSYDGPEFLVRIESRTLTLMDLHTPYLLDYLLSCTVYVDRDSCH